MDSRYQKGLWAREQDLKAPWLIIGRKLLCWIKKYAEVELLFGCANSLNRSVNVALLIADCLHAWRLTALRESVRALIVAKVSKTGGIMVLLGRIELPTSSLPMTRSTTELQQQPMEREVDVNWCFRKPSLDGFCAFR